MNERATKTIWHLFLAALAAYEMTQSKTSFRRAFCGGCAGYHLGAAYDDFLSKEEPLINKK